MGKKIVLGNFAVLDIRVVSRTDIGTYTCTATNQLGVSPPKSVDVDIYCKYFHILNIVWLGATY